MRRRDLIGTITGVALASPFRAVAASSADIGERIRREGLDRSAILPTMHMLADVHDPRLTGSPQAKSAGEWAIRQVTAWGMTNGHLEPWDFGHPGWTNERAVGFIDSPVREQLHFSPAAWTRGTTDLLRGAAVLIDPPQNTTRETLARYLASIEPLVRNRLVMTGASAPVTIDFDPPAGRLDNQTLPPSRIRSVFRRSRSRQRAA